MHRQHREIAARAAAANLHVDGADERAGRIGDGQERAVRHLLAHFVRIRAVAVDQEILDAIRERHERGDRVRLFERRDADGQRR